MSGIAAGECVEAVDGPVPVDGLAGKGMPVLTRLPSGSRGFRIISKVAASATPVPVVRIALDNGQAAILARAQGVFRIDLGVVLAAELAPGDVLEPSFHYPEGYRLRGAAAEEPGGGKRGWRVVSVVSAGEATVYSGRVNQTGCAFLSCGILCRLDG